MGSHRKGRIARAVALVGALLATLVLVVSFRAATSSSRQVASIPATALTIDVTEAAGRLAQALTYPTISSHEGADPEPFAALRAFLEASFPKAHTRLDHQVVGEGGLVYTWEGVDRKAAPLLLLAHADVVPVEPGTEENWTHPPFGGVVADGYIWGRGAMDCKSGVLGQLEAVEALLAEGFEPERTVILAFGHDEEVGGRRGAVAIAKRFAAEGRKFFFVLDEGMSVIHGLVPGVDSPVAMIGIAEKGYVTLSLRTTAEGGHSSMPPPHTASGIIARALTRLEDNPMPGGLSGPSAATFEFLAPEMGFGRRLVFANRWLFDPVIERIMSAKPATNALLRTTTAVTMMQGSVRENVLPIQATAAVNFRIRPGETQQDVIDYVNEVIDDERVIVTPSDEFGSDPSPVSPIQGAPFALLSTTARQIFPDAVVAPGLVLGATDARHYGTLSDHIYRFLPMPVGPGDPGRIHGTDERIAVSAYGDIIRFYAQLIRNASR